jgi:hypothetical protein
MKMKAYTSFPAWKKDQTPKNQRLITALTRIVEATDADLERFVKWGQGCWIKKNTPRVYIHAEPDHVQVGFYRGSSLSDPTRVLQGKGKHVRFVRIFDKSDINQKALTRLIEQVT